jgi:hypothetical protein
MKVGMTVILSLCVSLSLLNWAQSDAGPKNKLRLVAAEDGRTEKFPLSTYYSGTLINGSDEGVSVDAVEMPGGYQGGGQFFACATQIFSAQKGIWYIPHPIKLSDYEGARVKRVSVARGEKLEVCKRLLPEQEGHLGDSVRFALSLQWGQPPSTFSNTFKLNNIREKADSAVSGESGVR